MEKHINTINSLVKSEFISTLQFYIDYWTNRYDPEGDYNLGINRNVKLNDAKENYQNNKNNTVEDIKKYHKHDYTTCLRAAGRKLYLQAQDFSENPFIKIGNLRKVVLIKNMLFEAEPGYEIYSIKYLLNV